MTHTIQIDESLINEAKKMTGNKTEKGAAEKAIREYIQIQRKLQRVLKLKHSVDMK